MSVIISLFVLYSCGEEVESPVELSALEITGEAQGTTYSIIICDSNIAVTKSEIDSVLTAFDQVLSTYVESSVISKMNNASDSIRVIDSTGYFKRCYDRSLEVYQNTNGAFDPSVFPLVKGWGFMQSPQEPISKEEVDSLLAFVSFEPGELFDITFSGDEIFYQKKNAAYRLDFNAVAQGLSVDVLKEFLDGKGAKNYYLELGGELIISGKNREGDNWRIGIDAPIDSLDQRVLENIIHISNKAVATSGNYRKYYVKDGVKYAHTIDPITGYPVRHTLLSATVISDDCAKADAYATAFMVLGKEKTIQLLDDLEASLDVYLIYSDDSGDLKHWYTTGFQSYLK